MIDHATIPAPNLETHPRVSVLMCAYNAEPYLADAVRAVLGQTMSDFELIIIDDGSTDTSATTLDRFDDSRIRRFHQNNQGKPAAMNRAIDEARGEYLAVQDADDLCHPERLVRQMAYLEAHPRCAAVFCGHHLIINGRVTAPRCRAKSATACHEDVKAFRMPAHDPTVMYRAAMLGGQRYEPTLPLGEGHDYILRLGERHDLAVIGECLYGYRITLESITKRDPHLRQACVRRVLQRACNRRGLDLEALFPPHWFEVDEHDRRSHDNNLIAHFIESVDDQRHRGAWAAATRTAIRCARLHPLDFRYYRPLVQALAPTSLIAEARRARDRHRERQRVRHAVPTAEAGS
ncbi:MAG: glycosyltransferase family A protein [Planctomycetota bacterium]